MQYGDFVKGLYSRKGDYGNVVAVTTHYAHQIIENDKGQYFVDGILVESNVSTLEEVKRFTNLEDSVSETKFKIYEDISDSKVVKIIKKYSENTKVTTKLIESYMSLASSKVFTVDPVLLEMRTSYKLGNLIDGKLDFKLNDGKSVAISEDTMNKISNILNNSNDKEEILNYMRESVNNFMHVVKQV
jgi:hypothetical protein